MTIYFSSDLHFGHKNIITYCNRPWSNVEDMNQGLIDNWNTVVQPGDTVYLLGDVVMGKPRDTLPLVAELNGFKRLVPGNHDYCWEGHKKTGESWVDRYEEVGLPITTERQFVYNDEFFLLSHFPYTGDSHDGDRFVEYRPKDKGFWLLCGHVHNAWRHSGRQINVGTDVWDYAPVSIETLIEYKDNIIDV